jgi:hypothetical protein
MTNIFHEDWLRRFREDLRTGNINSLSSNVELAGLDILLDPEFCDLVCQEDARQVAILVGSLGEANAEDPKSFTRLRASYQYLTNRIDIDKATQESCSTDSRSQNFYKSLLVAAKNKDENLDITNHFATVTDLEFGIKLLINTGNSPALFSLLHKWQTVDRSDIPWLKTCRVIVKRGDKIELKDEARSLAKVSERLVDAAPLKQHKVAQEMRIQWSNFAYKAKDGELACKAAAEALREDDTDEIRFSLAKALILNKKDSAAIEHLHILLEESLSKYNGNFENSNSNNLSYFNVLAAEDTLISINKALKNKGLKPFLMSGTLLGYAREGGLLPHDKDIDLGIIGWDNQFVVAEALLEAGHFKIDLSQLTGSNRFLISAHDLRNGMAADIFLFHDKGDYFLHGIDFDMGFSQNFRFSKFGLQEVEFLDERFYAPDDIDRNLRENYGDWRTPAPSYVVTVESPALCDTPDTRTLLVYMEILKTITKRMKPQRVMRVLDHLDAHSSPLLGSGVRQQLRHWCAAQLSQAATATEAVA